MTQQDKDAALAALDTQISELQSQRVALEAEPVEVITTFTPNMPVPVGTYNNGIVSVSGYGDATSLQVQIHRPDPHAAVVHTVSPIGDCDITSLVPDAVAFQVQGKFWSPDGVPDAESGWSEVITIA